MQRTKCPVVPIEQARKKREQAEYARALRQIIERANKTDW